MKLTRVYSSRRRRPGEAEVGRSASLSVCDFPGLRSPLPVDSPPGAQLQCIPLASAETHSTRTSLPLHACRRLLALVRCTAAVSPFGGVVDIDCALPPRFIFLLAAGAAALSVVCTCKLGWSAAQLYDVYVDPISLLHLEFRRRLDRVDAAAVE